jgi:hypothetical protein
MSFLKSPLALRFARVSSVLIGLSALGGIVVLAHRQANPPALASATPAPAEKRAPSQSLSVGDGYVSSSKSVVVLTTIADDVEVTEPGDEPAADSPATRGSLPVVQLPASYAKPLPAGLVDPNVFPAQPIAAPAARYLPSSKSIVVSPELLVPFEVVTPVPVTPPVDPYISSSKSAVVRPTRPPPPAQKSP